MFVLTRAHDFVKDSRPATELETVAFRSSSALPEPMPAIHLELVVIPARRVRYRGARFRIHEKPTNLQPEAREWKNASGATSLVFRRLGKRMSQASIDAIVISGV